MKLTAAQRSRLAEIIAYSPSGRPTLYPVYRDDKVDRALLAKGAIKTEVYRIRLPGRPAIEDVTLCWATEAGVEAIG